MDVFNPIFKVHGPLLHKAERFIKIFEVQLSPDLNGTLAVEPGHFFKRSLHQGSAYPVPAYLRGGHHPSDGWVLVGYPRRNQPGIGNKRRGADSNAH